MKCSELKVGMRVGTDDLPWCDAESPFATVEATGSDWAVLRTPNGNTYLSSDEDDLEEYVPPAAPCGPPVVRPRIVCLCGSTRFMQAFFDVGWQKTLDGEIVLSVGVCKHAEHHGAEALGQDVADRLDELHLRKIGLADYVYVLNVGGYIGESTRREIEYAEQAGKPVEYLEPLEEG